MERILFLDIDGVLLPRRSYYTATQTKPLVSEFCPSIVGMVNSLAEDSGCKFVVHSSWLRTCFAPTGERSVKGHMIFQGLKEEYFHSDWHCIYTRTGDRWTAIGDWLSAHDEVDYLVLEDEPIPEYCTNPDPRRVITTNFDDGFTWSQLQAALTWWKV